MDWIEQIWHINPDNGSGTLEVAVMLAVTLLVVLAARETGCRCGTTSLEIVWRAPYPLTIPNPLRNGLPKADNFNPERTGYLIDPIASEFIAEVSLFALLFAAIRNLLNAERVDTWA